VHLDTSRLEVGRHVDFTFWYLPSGPTVGSDYRITIV
jgi:hypothetical protein